MRIQKPGQKQTAKTKRNKTQSATKKSQPAFKNTTKKI
jgi:hypothetical protein